MTDDRIPSVSCPAVNTIGDLDNDFDVGEAMTCTGTYTVVSGDLAAGSVTNTASATANNPSGGSVTSPQDNATAFAIGSVALVKTGSIVDTNSDTIIGNAGDSINYSFTVTNTGGVPLNNISINDPLVVVSGGPLVSLAPGASDSSTFTATYTITGTDVVNGQVTNQATVFATDINSNPVSDLSDDSSNTEDDPTVTTLNGDIGLVKTGVVVDTNLDLILGNAGDTINYTFTVINTGPVALNNITVTDPLVTVVGGPLASLAPGATDNTTFSAAYTITAADVLVGSVTNQAIATGFGPSGNPVNDVSDDNSPTEDDPTIISFVAEIALIKTGTVVDTNSDTVLGNAGDTIDYAFTVTNTGPVTLTNVTVTDPLVTVNGGPVASMAPGAVDSTTFTATYTITAADVTAGQVSNQAMATGDDPASNPVTDLSDDNSNTEDDPTIIVVGSSAALDFIKEYNLLTFVDVDSSGNLSSGDMVDYRFTVTNIGDTVVENVTLDETTPIPLPLAATNLTAISNCLVNGLTPATNGSITLNLTDSVVCDATYTIPDVPTLILFDNDPATAGSQLPNHAQVTGTPQGGGTPVTHPSDDPDTPIVDDPTVIHIDLPPLANDDESLNNPIGTPVVLSILNNDELSDGTTPGLLDVFVDVDASTPSVLDVTNVVAGEGTWTYDPGTGDVTFTPDPALLGNPTPLVYLLTERSTNLLDGATMTITYVLSDATVSGNVFDDTSGSEVGLPGVTVELYSDNDGDGLLSAGDLLATAVEVNTNNVTTGAAGDFSFTVHVPGNYLLVQTNLAGYNSFVDEDRTLGGDDANPVSNDDWLPVTVASGEVDDGNVFVDRQNSVTLVKSHDPGTQHVDVDSDGQVSAGDILTYTVTATNNSAVAVTNFELTDLLAGIFLDTGSCAITDVGTPGDTTNPPVEAGVVFQFASFGAGDTVACNFSYIVSSANEMTQCSVDNIAQASGNGISTVTDNLSVAVAPAAPNAIDDSFVFDISGHLPGAPFDYAILPNDSMRDGVTTADHNRPTVSVELVAPPGATQIDPVTVDVPGEGAWTYANGVASFLALPSFLSGGSPMVPTPIQYRLIEDPTGEVPPGCQVVEDLATISFTMVTTPVTLSYFATEALLNGDVRFNWQTEMEVATLGYNIYARGKDGWFRVNQELVQSVGYETFEPQVYEMFVPGIDAEWFSLVDVSNTEELTVHGPYRLGRSYGEYSEHLEEMDWQDAREELLNTVNPDSMQRSVNDRIRDFLDADERAQRDSGAGR